MNKNATLMSHLQNAAIAVLTVTAVLLLIQTPLVGDLAGGILKGHGTHQDDAQGSRCLLPLPEVLHLA